MFYAILLLLLLAAVPTVYILLRQPTSTATPHPTSTPPGTPPKLKGNGRFSVEVVGESFYRHNLAQMYPRSAVSDDNDDELDDEVEAVATLTLDDNNPHDKNAVAVHIDGKQVGHLSRKMAQDFRHALLRDGLSRYTSFRVDAIVRLPNDITDSQSHFSISLDLPETK